jgi:hypothetical protein
MKPGSGSCCREDLSITHASQSCEEMEGGRDGRTRAMTVLHCGTKANPRQFLRRRLIALEGRHEPRPFVRVSQRSIFMRRKGTATGPLRHAGAPP